MGVLDDKKYEELDWLSKAIEPIQCEFNNILARMPDEFVMDFETLKSLVNNSYGYLGFSKFTVLQHLATNLIPSNFDHQECELLSNCYEMVTEANTFVNFEQNTLSNTIKLRKTIALIDDEKCAQLMGVKGVLALRAIESTYSWETDENVTKRLNEILDLLGDEEGLRQRSFRKKSHRLTTAMQNIMRENKFNIRNVELSNKVGVWIYSYVLFGNLAAYVNFCKIKAMTHKGMPIYSIEEEIA